MSILIAFIAIAGVLGGAASVAASVLSMNEQRDDLAFALDLSAAALREAQDDLIASRLEADEIGFRCSVLTDDLKSETDHADRLYNELINAKREIEMWQSEHDRLIKLIRSARAGYNDPAEAFEAVYELESYLSNY